MKPCIWCGFTFEHSEATCKALVAEKREEPKVVMGRRKLNPARMIVSQDDILKLAAYLSGKGGK